VSDKLWVFGGSNGGDVLRNGDELIDMFALALPTMTWSRVNVTGVWTQRFWDGFRVRF
jgi:hypothetical protein